MRKIIISFGTLITILTFYSCGSTKSVECECVDELNSMNYTSEKYENCIDIAIAANAEKPLQYFQSKCDK